MDYVPGTHTREIEALIEKLFANFLATMESKEEAA